MSDWKSYVDEKFGSVKTTQKQQSSKPVGAAVKLKSLALDNFGLPLVLLICILSICMVSSYNYKNFGTLYASSSVVENMDARAYQDYVNNDTRRNEYLSEHQRSELNAGRGNEMQLYDVVRETYNVSKTNRERLTLLGVLYNNNMAAAKKGSRDYIYINADWTIDRYPAHLTLSDSDKRFLDRFVVKKK